MVHDYLRNQNSREKKLAISHFTGEIYGYSQITKKHLYQPKRPLKK